MISLAETRYAFRGLFRILRFDPSFLQFYDRSHDGAVRSFGLALPFLAIFLFDLIVARNSQQPPVGLRMSLSLIVAYAINWAYFPLFLFWIGRFIDRESRIIGCITIYNWLSLLTLFTDLPVSLLNWAGANEGFLQILTFAGLMVYLVCEGYVLAVCLQISALFSAAFVILDFVLHEILFAFAGHLGTSPLF